MARGFFKVFYLTMALPCACMAMPTDASGKYFTGGLYCHKVGKSLDIFAGRVLKGGNLKFGINRWREDGQNFSIINVAKPYGSGWRYIEYKSGSNSGCSIDINFTDKFDVSVAVDGNLNCASYAGYGFTNKSFSLPARHRKAPERGVLDDPEKFSGAEICAIVPK